MTVNLTHEADWFRTKIVTKSQNVNKMSTSLWKSPRQKGSKHAAVSLRSHAPKVLSVAHFLSFFKRVWTSHLETLVCFERFAWERPCSCSITILGLVAVLLWYTTTWNPTLAADFSCSSPIFKPPTQLFLFQLMTVSTYIWNWWSLASGCSK